MRKTSKIEYQGKLIEALTELQKKIDEMQNSTTYISVGSFAIAAEKVEAVKFAILGAKLKPNEKLELITLANQFEAKLYALPKIKKNSSNEIFKIKNIIRDGIEVPSF